MKDGSKVERVRSPGKEVHGRRRMTVNFLDAHPTAGQGTHTQGKSQGSSRHQRTPATSTEPGTTATTHLNSGAIQHLAATYTSIGAQLERLGGRFGFFFFSTSTLTVGTLGRSDSRRGPDDLRGERGVPIEGQLSSVIGQRRSVHGEKGYAKAICVTNDSTVRLAPTRCCRAPGPLQKWCAFGAPRK